MYPLPTAFLIARTNDEIARRNILVPCPQFDDQKWRYQRFAWHLTDWLPEFAYRPDDLPNHIENMTEARKLMERSIAHLYQENSSSSRGELGELLLHVCCRQFFGTFPAVNKIYYKTSSNEVVKGFDLAHVRVEGEKIEIWLGEAKFFQDGRRAVGDAIKSVNGHLDRGFLQAEKTLLGGKISRATPGYERLQWMFDADTPLDEIFDRIVVPILTTYNSPACASYEDDISYLADLEPELVAMDAAFQRSKTPVAIAKIIIPMNTKKLLQDEFDRRLGFFRP